MGIGSFTPVGLWGSFQSLLHWLGHGPHPVPTPYAPSSQTARTMAGASNSNHDPAHTSSPRPPVTQRPVRVLRVIDSPQSTASAGRMLISGRMADVCAELDRLTALETGPSVTGFLQ